MNIFHRLCRQDTIDFVNVTPDLLRLVAELCQQFKVKVLDHNRDGARKVLLAEDNGVPFGVASINFNTKGELNYQFNAPFIEKERGRGSDRSARKSIKLPALIKLLKKDHEENYEPSINRLVSRLSEAIKDLISRDIGQERYSRDIGQDTTKALIGFFTEQKIITDPAILKTIDEYVVKMKENEDKKLQRESKLDEFKTDLYLIIEGNGHTFLAGTFKYDATANKYSIHEDVNCYTSIDDLEQTHPQLMLSYKMYRVGTENKVDFNQNIVPLKDKYFPDFEVITYYFMTDSLPSVQAFENGNTHIRMLLTPKLG
jgi:hypothetical protein